MHVVAPPQVIRFQRHLIFMSFKRERKLSAKLLLRFWSNFTLVACCQFSYHGSFDSRCILPFDTLCITQHSAECHADNTSGRRLYVVTGNLYSCDRISLWDVTHHVSQQCMPSIVSHWQTDKQTTLRERDRRTVTDFLKLTMACRSSPVPMMCTDVTLPYFLYSWNSPSRTLELLDLTGKPRINIPTGFLSRSRWLLVLVVAGSLVTVESLAAPCDELPGDDRPVPLAARLSRSWPPRSRSAGWPSPWLQHITTSSATAEITRDAWNGHSRLLNINRCCAYQRGIYDFLVTLNSKTSYSLYLCQVRMMWCECDETIVGPIYIYLHYCTSIHNDKNISRTCCVCPWSFWPPV